MHRLTNSQRRDMVNQAKIAFVMIVKNEEENIRRCLKSIRQFAYDIIILDTGSKDRTVKYCRGYSANVTEMKWKGKWDFSKARNIVFDMARKTPAKWCFIIDADEWLSDRDDGDWLLRAAVMGLRDGSDGFQVRIHSFFKKIGLVGTWLPSVRLCRNNNEWKYTGSVHNQLSIHGRIGQIPCKVSHTGYDLSPEKALEKHKRSCTLLLQQVHETHGKASFPWFNLVKEYNSRGEWHKALRCVEHAMPILKEQGRLKRENVMCSIFHLASHAAIQVEVWDKAIDYARQGIEAIDDFPDFWFDLVQIYSIISDIEEMEKAYEKYVECVRKYAKGRMVFVQEVARCDYVGHAEYFRAAAYEHSGNIDKARECFRNAMKANPRWADPCLAAARMERLNEGDATEAIRLYGEAAQITPSGTNLAEMAEMLYLVGEKEKATTFMGWSKTRFELEDKPERAEKANEWLEIYGDKKEEVA